MQPNQLTAPALEELYAKVILPQFGISGDSISWIEQRTIGPNNEARVFKVGDEQMVLVFDDYPTTTVETISKEFGSDSVTQIHRSNTEGSVGMDAHSSDNDNQTLMRFSIESTPFTHAHGITGYFQLFRLGGDEDAIKLNRLKTSKRALHGVSEVYAALLDVGFELIALGRKNAPLDALIHISQSMNDIATNHNFRDLSLFFFGFAVDSECYEGLYNQPIESYFIRAKGELQTLASSANINPGITGRDQELVDSHTLPIHTKMMINPEDSEAYFVELAHALNRLIAEEDLSVLAAGRELSHALDRPQVESSTILRPAVLAAYELELPRTLRNHDPEEQWNKFYVFINELAITGK